MMKLTLTFCPRAARREKRIRRSQRLGRLNLRTRRPRADVGHIDELGGAAQRPGNLALTLGEIRRGAGAQGYSLPKKGR